MSLNDRLALAAMRGVMHELEGDPAGAGEVLARLFGGGVVERDPKPRNAIERDVELEVIEAVEAARAAGRKGGKRPGPRPRPPKAPASPAGEHVELVEQLVARHESVNAAAAAAGVSPAVFRRWRSGKAAPAHESLEKLRAATAGPRKKKKPARRRRRREDDGDEREGEQVPTTEAQGYVLELTERFGDLGAAAAATGFGLDHLTRWNAGGPCSPRALERLREAAHPPLSRREREAQEATPAAASDEAAAGAGDDEEEAA